MATCLPLANPFKLDVICLGFTEAATALPDNGLAPNAAVAADDEELSFSLIDCDSCPIWFFPATKLAGSTTPRAPDAVRLLVNPANRCWPVMVVAKRHTDQKAI